jgi:hypothetical protein
MMPRKLLRPVQPWQLAYPVHPAELPVHEPKQLP